MRKEQEIRKELQNFRNQSRNFATLYEDTGNFTFRERAMEAAIFSDALAWVLKEHEITDKTFILYPKTGDITDGEKE